MEKSWWVDFYDLIDFFISLVKRKLWFFNMQIHILSFSFFFYEIFISLQRLEDMIIVVYVG